MSTVSSASQDEDYHDYQLNQTLISCTNNTVQSQERIEASIQASSRGIEALLTKIVDSLAKNQQQMIKILKRLEEDEDYDDRGRMDNNEMREEEVHEDEVVKNVASQNNQQQDTFVPLGIEEYMPLAEALGANQWENAMEYLRANKTHLQRIFAKPDSGNQIHFLFTSTLIPQNQVMLLKEFLKIVPPEALEYTNPRRNFGTTVLHSAAIEGNLRAAKALVEHNRKLPQIRGTKEPHRYVPLVIAATYASDGQKDVLEYLCSVTRDEDPSPVSGVEWVVLLKSLILAEMHGVALSMFQRFPESVGELLASPHAITVLKDVVERPFLFRSGTKLSWWKRGIYSILEKGMGNELDGIKNISELNTLEEGTKGDEENPLRTLKRENPREIFERKNSSTSNKRTIISMCIRYIKRVPCFNRLYDQMLKQRQVIQLVKRVLAELNNKNNKIAQLSNDGTIEKKVFAILLKSGILEKAINSSSTEFVLECLSVFPFLCDREELLRLAVRERNELIYNLMCILRRMQEIDRVTKRDKEMNTILHVCAEVAHNRQLNAVSGAAFQMQREIQWFKGVENTMLEKDRFIRNNEGQTAQFLFTEKHKPLMEKAEKWMKELSTSCMVVAALIATVAFAAAITVPGGNISDKDSGENGLPVFLHNKSFMLFAITDALALFSSVTSVLMFLTVFTSRYSEEDFLKSLPEKIIIGLFTLFISMATMLVSFGAIFTIVVGRGSVWAPITVSLLGFVPILLFGFMQFPLLLEMVRSTYWPITLGKEDNPLLEPYIQKKEKNVGGIYAWSWVTSSFTQMVHRCRVAYTWFQMSVGL